MSGVVNISYYRKFKGKHLGEIATSPVSDFFAWKELGRLMTPEQYSDVINNFYNMRAVWGCCSSVKEVTGG